MAQLVDISRLSGAAARLRITMFGLALVLAAGCSAVYRNHGYVPADTELALIEVGVDTRETVAATVGRPSTAGLLNDLGWYYVQSRWKHSGALPPREEDRQIVAISFTETGVVENIERFGIEQGRVVALSRRVTDSNIKGMSILRQLFGSLGRLRADQLLKN
jgi:outer membrane protein assembly factor BamE (lipoprotein component of BamABCDE complex)